MRTNSGHDADPLVSGNEATGLIQRDAKIVHLARRGLLSSRHYVSFDRYQSGLLFKVIADRSERDSVIVTTNLPFSEWATLFENTAMVAAMVDRLTFHSYILDMNGQSYRLEQAKKQKR